MTTDIIRLHREHIDDNTYTIVENFIIDHPALGGTEIAVYVILAKRAHMPKRTLKASIVWLAERTGWQRNTVSKAIDKLIEVGAVARGEREAGASYTYTLLHRHRTKAKAKKAA